MKYFVVTSTIADGEYEYLQQSPVEAKTEADARRRVARENREWIRGDYRRQEINRITEVTEAEFDVIRKYIY